MDQYTVEYLIIIERSAFCNDTSALKNLFQANVDISIDDETILYKSKKHEFTLLKKFEENKLRYFNLTIRSEREEDLDVFSELLREIRKLIINNKGKIEILHDDISFYYSQKAYPLINRIENLMRKLITLFLIESNGLNWGKTAIPIDIHDRKSSNILNKTDFINLGEILTKEYPLSDISSLQNMIESAISIEDIDFNKLKSFVPKSNLDRYFKPYIDFNSEYLNKKWKRLYELRCLVAHNNFFYKNDFVELESLIDEVKEKLKKAIDNIENVEIPEEDKDTILEFTISNSDELVGTFINKWKQLEQKLSIFNNAPKNSSIIKNIRKIYEDGYFSEDIYKKISRINEFRNKLVHLTDMEFDITEITNNIQITSNITEQLVLEKDFNNTWPLTVDRGVIENIKGAVVFRHKNKEYGLIGLATSMGYSDIDKIWKNNPEIPGTKISIGILINIGLAVEKT